MVTWLFLFLSFGCSLLQGSIQQANLREDLAIYFTMDALPNATTKPLSYHRITRVKQGAAI